jgi:hypothetical protein
VLRAIGAVAIGASGLIACRIGFDPLAGDAGDGPGSSASPPVPAEICSVERIAIGATADVIDLAVGPTPEGHAAAWLDPRTGVTTAITLGARGADGRHPELARATLPMAMFAQLNGLVSIGPNLVLAGSDAMGSSVLAVDRGLPTDSLRQTTTTIGAMAGRDPFPSDAQQTRRVFVRAINATFHLSYLDNADGRLNPNAFSTFNRGGTITEFACDDGPTHSHCAWAETSAGSTACYVSDVLFDVMPEIPVGPLQLARDCSDLRGASGPDAADALLTVLTIPRTPTTRAIEAHYESLQGSIRTEIAPSGSAPKVRFDGEQFWTAWLDGDALLHLSSFGVPSGPVAIDTVALPGWIPAGPEAFELVRRPTAGGFEIDLVIISAGDPGYLSFLSICPPPGAAP